MVLSQYWGIVQWCYHSTGVLCNGVITVLGCCDMVLPQYWGVVTRCYHSTGVLCHGVTTVLVVVQGEDDSGANASDLVALSFPVSIPASIISDFRVCLLTEWSQAQHV